MILEAIKGRGQARSRGFIEVIGTLHYIATKAFDKVINGHLQLAASTEIVEEAGLGMIIAADEIVRD